MGGFTSRNLAICCTIAMVILLGPPRVSAAPDDIVVNEVHTYLTPSECTCFQQPPACPFIESVEILNRGNATIDLSNWWICDQPSSFYLALIPPGSTQGVVLQPGDFLVIRFSCDLPLGNFVAMPNSAGTTTHRFDLPLWIQPFISAENGNFSLWDHSPPGSPTNPDFNSPQFIRDIVAWGAGGVYRGNKRVCQASQAVPPIWPPPFQGNCITTPPDQVFSVAVNSDRVIAAMGMTNLSINYNRGSANNPSDYFIAPATIGEPNRMPGDLDGDLDMDMADYNVFVGCLGQAAKTPPCSLADFDQNSTVTCADWPQFASFWIEYSLLPPPLAPQPCLPCIKGDCNYDGVVNGRDINRFANAIVMYRFTEHVTCQTDMDDNHILDCVDVQLFTNRLLMP